MRSRLTYMLAFSVSIFLAAQVFAQREVPPDDIWPDTIMTQIRDRSTLEMSIDPQFGYAEVYLTSNPSASFFDAKDPYAEHPNEKIRIHGYLAYPAVGGPFPAVIIGHGHGGKADLSLAQLVASLGLVALTIDGPQAGKSTGGPADDFQAWISVDKGAQYGYLYHYAYAGMRGLTLLEVLAEQAGNPYKIDATKLGAIGVSMGGIITTYMNSVDNRLKAAIVVASAGNWGPSLRIPNSWLYHAIYTGTRDLPYDGKDPQNSIEDVDSDSTAISFLNHFDPIRYTRKQYAPVMTLIGTHDEYFPLLNANLMELAITAGAGAQPNFEKRLWLIPNATHGTFNSVNLMSLSSGLRQWLDYCFGKRARPLAVPQIALTETPDGMRLDITTGESVARLAGASLQFFAATRVDSTVNSITDFKTFTPLKDLNNNFFVSIPAGEKSPSGDAYTAQNIIYFATISDSLGLPVSCPVYKGKLPIDLNTDFVPVIEHSPEDQIIVPVPPTVKDAARTFSSSITLPADASYQGMALSNPTDSPMAVRLEARTMDGRLATGEGLINAPLLSIAPRAQRIFLVEEWMGKGARQLNGSLQVAWNDKRGTSLSFRGNVSPSNLDAIGPLATPAKSLWLPVVPEQDRSISRRLRFFSGSASDAVVNLTYKARLGEMLANGQVTVPAWGTAELVISVSTSVGEVSTVQMEASAPISARMEVRPARDAWSIEALPVSQSTRFIQPHAEWNGTYKTRFVIINTASSAGRNVIFKRHTKTGALIGKEMTVFMEKSQTASLTLESVFAVSAAEAPGAGWVEAGVAEGGVLIQALANDPVSSATAVSPVGSGDGGNLSMPYFVENPGYWTGLALANGGSSRVTADFVAYSYTGDVLGRASVTLGAGESKVQLVHEWISGLPADASGQIVITASAPISLLAYFGTVDGASLAAIPFTPMTP